MPAFVAYGCWAAAIWESSSLWAVAFSGLLFPCLSHQGRWKEWKGIPPLPIFAGWLGLPPPLILVLCWSWLGQIPISVYHQHDVRHTLLVVLPLTGFIVIPSQKSHLFANCCWPKQVSTRHRQKPTLFWFVSCGYWWATIWFHTSLSSPNLLTVWHCPASFVFFWLDIFPGDNLFIKKNWKQGSYERYSPLIMLWPIIYLL